MAGKTYRWTLSIYRLTGLVKWVKGKITHTITNIYTCIRVHMCTQIWVCTQHTAEKVDIESDPCSFDSRAHGFAETVIHHRYHKVNGEVGFIFHMVQKVDVLAYQPFKQLLVTLHIQKRALKKDAYYLIIIKNTFTKAHLDASASS